MQIYIDRNGQQMGPFTLEQVQEYLAQGSLLPTDTAWYEGLETWVPLSQLVPQQAEPVPVVPAPVEAAAVLEQGAAEATVPAQGGRKKKLLIAIGAGVGVLAILAAVWFFLIRDDGSKSGSADANIPAPWVPPGEPGKLIWEFETGSGVVNTPAIGSDGTVYVGSWDLSHSADKVYALDGKTGVKKWEFEPGDGVVSSPAIGSDGTVYVGAGDKKVYALDGKSGARKWEFGTGSGVRSSPAIGSDGTVYVGSLDNKLYALDGKTGAKKWEFVTPRRGRAPNPTIGSDGTVYAGSWDNRGHGHVYALDGKTGAKKWEFETEDEIISSPAIGADGTVYVGTDKGKVYALAGKNLKTIFVNGKELLETKKQWEFEAGRMSGYGNFDPVIGANGIVYIGSTVGKVYAVASSSQGLAKSPWPMRGQNAQHTGRAPKK